MNTSSDLFSKEAVYMIQFVFLQFTMQLTIEKNGWQQIIEINVARIQNCICLVHIQYLFSTFLVALALLGSRKKDTSLTFLEEFLQDSHDIYRICSVTPRTLCHLCVQTYQKIFVYESSNSNHLPETILNIRDAKWFIYFWMPLYPSISISQTHSLTNSLTHKLTHSLTLLLLSL